MSKLRALFATVIAVSCTISARSEPASGSFVDILNIPRVASQLDGKRVSTRGFILLSDMSLDVVSTSSYDKRQVCIGLLLTRERLDQLRKYNETWGTVSGVFSTHYCTGNDFCAYSCGPYTLSNIDIEK
jgi:hypothetical protein